MGSRRHFLAELLDLVGWGQVDDEETVYYYESIKRESKIGDGDGLPLITQSALLLMGKVRD